VLSVPRLTDSDMASGPDTSPRTAARQEPQTAELRAQRVMIVEDEALIAMVLVENLQEMGLSAVRAYSRVADAFEGAQAIDAAILDVNLGGDPVYPVAEMLSARSIPFVFMTGYGSASIDPRFAHVPVLQKPIEAKALEDMFVSRGAPIRLRHDSE